MNGLLHYSSILREMPPRSRQSLVRALLKQVPEPSSPAVIVVRPDRSGLAPIKTNGHRANHLEPAYDPSMVFVLELATIMATRDHESITLMGQTVANTLQTAVRNVANIHPLALARAVFYLLYLLNASQVSVQSKTANDLAEKSKGLLVCPSTRHTSYHCGLSPINSGENINAGSERFDTLYSKPQLA